MQPIRPKYVCTLVEPKFENFKSWLTKNGVEVLLPGEWEQLRFHCSAGYGIVYFNASGRLTWNALAIEAWYDFGLGQAFHYRAQTAPREKLRKSHLPLLLARDGNKCFICGKEMRSQDASIEHLLDRAFGGTNHIANLALAHEECNKGLSGVGSLAEKINLIIARRQA